MARKKEKTLEEKLQEALVPENQWPYILPENWCWVKLNKLYNVNPKNILEDDSVDAAFIPMANIEPNFIGKYKFEVDSWNKVRKGHTQFADGDVTFAKISPCFENGKAFIAENLPNGIGAGTTELIVLRNRKIVPKYTFYLISTEKFVNGGRRTYSGVVGQQRISIDYVNQFPIPLSPLPEQKRIVHRIESLFAKLDEAKEKIQQVLDGAEMRKAAILHKAFTGELTQNWRKENSVSVSELLKNISEKLLKFKKKKIKKVSNLYSQSNIPHEWTWVELDDIAYKITDGEHATPKRVDNFCGFYLLSARNVRNDELKLDDVDYVAEDEYIRISKRCNPHMGDVLISCSGSVGRCCVITDNEKYVMVRSAAVISPILCNPKFIMYMIMSRDVQAQIKSLCKQTAQANLFIGAIASIKIPLPSLEEQDYIADLVGELFYKEKCSVEHCSKILFDIDTMKKSILAKAFRGELGTNNPTEDSALNLLKEVLQDKF